MTEEQRRTFDAEMAKPWTSMRELNQRLFLAGAAWGAAARQRFDAEICRSMERDMPEDSDDCRPYRLAYDDCVRAIESQQMPGDQ